MPRISLADVRTLLETTTYVSEHFQGGHSELGRRVTEARHLLDTLEMQGEDEQRLVFSDAGGQIEVVVRDEFLEVRGVFNSIVIDPVASNTIRVRTK